MKIKILGCGGSRGVGVDHSLTAFGACNPHNPFNRRTRSSIVVKNDTTRILVDCGPDIREQIDLRTTPLSALLFTHGDADHIHGSIYLDDIYNQWPSSLGMYGDEASLWAFNQRIYNVYDENKWASYHRYLSAIEAKYKYFAQNVCRRQIDPTTCLLPELMQNDLYRYRNFTPTLLKSSLNDIASGTFKIGDLTITPFLQKHWDFHSWGFLFTDAAGATCAYSTDVSEMYPKVLKFLKGIDLWIVDCGKMHSSKSHSYWEQTKDWISEVKPTNAILTHMNRGMDYDVVAAMVGKDRFDHVQPACDGMTAVWAGDKFHIERPAFNRRTFYNRVAAAES